VPAGATGAKGTVTREKVADWIEHGFRWKHPETKEWRTQDAETANTALRHQGTIGIDVDDYGSKEGARQLAELEAVLGPLPATITSTARGDDDPSRQYFYRLPVEAPPETVFMSKAAKDIEIIQRSHRYSIVYPSIHPDTGAQYQWYNYEGEPFTGGNVPSLEDFETLPWAWVDFLMKGDAERPAQAEQWDGEQPAAASADEERKVATIIEMLGALPAVWQPGAGWHDTVFRSACWLSRMVNSNAYALTADQALTVLLTHTPVYPEWAEDKIVEQWESAVRSTEGQFEEPPLAARPPLLQPITVLDKLSSKMWDLFYFEPTAKTEGAAWDLRHRIMVAALEEGHTPEFAASAAWHSRFGGEDLRFDVTTGEARLWREFDQAATAVRSATGETVEPAPASERPVIDQAGAFIPLLTDAERKAVQFADEFRWWGTRYLEWARTRVGLWNAPYHRMNRWHILSLVFSPYAFAPKKRGAMHFNLFGFVLGPSTTGKTESTDIMRPVWKAFFPIDDPDIGGDATPNGLIEKLIERDGKPSFFNKDEAHGLFREIAGASWLAGLIERLTALYDCRVPMMQRAMKKDLSGKNAKSFFVMHLMGVEEELVPLLDESMWKSGFLARFVWAVGDAIEIAPEDLEFDEMEGDAAEIMHAYDAMPRQWAAEFNSTIREAKLDAETPRPVRYEQAAKERHLEFQRLLMSIYKGHKYEAMLKPSLLRFGDNVRKCASLVALSEGSLEVSLKHELIALEQAEEWLPNLLRMVATTTATGFARDMEMIEKFVHSSARGSVRKERVYLHMSPRLTKWDVDKLLENLVAQGRITDHNTREGVRLIAIKQEGAVAA